MLPIDQINLTITSLFNRSETTIATSTKDAGWANLTWKGKEWLQVIYIVLAMVGILGNSAVLWIYLGTRELRRQITNVFIINLAFSDMFTCGLIIPFKVVTYPIPAGLIGEILCRVFVSQYFLWASGLTSVYTLLWVTIERYYALMHGFRYQRIYTRKRAIYMCGFSWIIALLGQIYEFFTFSYENQTCKYETMALSNILIPYEGLVILSLNGIMLACYLRIRQNLQRSMRTVRSVYRRQSLPTFDARERDTVTATKRLTKMMFMVVGGYFVCWIGVGTFNIILIWYPDIYNGMKGELVILLAISNSTINPFIYCLKSRTFSNNLLRKLGKQPKTHIPDFLVNYTYKGPETAYTNFRLASKEPSDTAMFSSKKTDTPINCTALNSMVQKNIYYPDSDSATDYPTIITDYANSVEDVALYDEEHIETSVTLGGELRYYDSDDYSENEIIRVER